MGEAVMLPDVGAEPCSAQGPQRGGDAVILGSAVAPEVGVVVAEPAVYTVHLPGHFLPVGLHPFQVLKEGQVHVGKIADLGGPVVHFRVDVDGVFAAPGGTVFLVPQALQGGGPAAGTAAGGHQVPAKGEQVAAQAQIVFSLLHPFQPDIVGQLLKFRIRRQLQGAALHNGHKVCQMLGKKGIITLGFRSIQATDGIGQEAFALPDGGGGSQQQNGMAAALQDITHNGGIAFHSPHHAAVAGAVVAGGTA